MAPQTELTHRKVQHMYTDTLNPEFAINYWLFGGYGVIALLLSTLLTRTLFTNGSIFLKEVFGSDSELSKSVNHLLAVGFFMFHLGWALMYMNPVGTESPGEAFGLVVKRLALLLIMSGILHGANMVVLFSIRRRGLRTQSAPRSGSYFEQPSVEYSPLLPPPIA